MALVLVQPVKAVTDDCYTGYRWMGALYNDSTGDYTEYLPTDFFGPDGASIPGYIDTLSYLHPYFYMNDTTCASDNWSIRFSGITSVGNWGEALAVVGIDIIGYSPTPSLTIMGKPRYKNLHIEAKDTIKKRVTYPGLKSYTSSYVMGFDYRNDTLYFYRNGYYYKKMAYHVCKVVNPEAYWEQMGGTLTKLDYYDYANGTEYHEDFTDCSNTQEFPECEPVPEVTLDAYFELPNCHDSTLQLHANSNLLDELHWEGPDGFTAEGTDITINYEDAKSGTYLVWGHLDPCSDAAYQLLDIQIPKLRKDTNYMVTSCHGDTVRVGDHVYTENGIYYDTLKTAEGCDSIVVTFYKFYYRVSEYNDTICQGSSYLFNGRYLTEAGTYTDTVKVPECNCDSIVTLHLSTYQITGEATDSLCKGQTYQLGDLAITESGTYTNTLKTESGCDSLVTLSISFFQLEDRIKDTICIGSSYDFHGQTITQAGTYKTTYTNDDGCDVNATLSLHTYEIKTEGTQTLCHGDTVKVGNHFYTESATYYDTLKTDGGCDSIVISNLEFNYRHGEYTDNICKGSKYIFGDRELTESGTYIDTVKVPGCNCDSIVTLHLKVYQITGKETESLCKGKTFHFGELDITANGTYTQTFKTDGGCDSTATLNITFFQKQESIEETICEGSFYDFYDEKIEKAGTYKTTYTDEEGCSVIASLKLTTYTIKENVYDTICQGQEYTFNGETYTKSGVYRTTLKTDGGCDSTVVLHLNVQKPERPTVVNITICKGDSLVYQGHTFKKAGNVRDTLINRFGCDSMVVYKVQIEHSHDTSFVYHTCEDTPVLVETGEWISTDTTFYTYLHYDNYECDVRTYISVVAHPSVHLNDTTIHLCGKHKTRVRLDSLKHVLYQWLPTEGVQSPHSRNTIISFAGDSATYHVALSNNYCVDTMTVKLTYSPAPTIELVEVDKDGENLIIDVNGGTPPYLYQIDTTVDWHTNIDFGKMDIGVHDAYIVDSKGCMVHKPFIYLIPVIPAKFMTPNGDGIHDTWEIKNLEYYDVYTVEIFDRWGKSLITYKNEYPGWDGIYNGQKMPTTDYWYVISVDMNEQVLTGHFTLLRQ